MRVGGGLCVAVGAVSLVAACGRFGFADHARTNDPSDAAILESVGPWSNLTPISALETTQHDADPSVTADGLELYEASFRAGTLGASDLWVSTRASSLDTWPPPVHLGSASSVDNDDSPEISSDGLTLWLMSTRNNSGGAVFVCTRPDRASAWSAATHVTELDGPSLLNVAFSGDGLVAMVEHSDGTGNEDLYEHRRASPTDAWGPESHVDELSTAYNESSPALDATGLVVYFTSNRPGTAGVYDVWTASRPTLGDPFLTPVRVEEIDGDGDDGNPFLSRDGHTLYWSSDRAPDVGMRDLWYATR